MTTLNSYARLQSIAGLQTVVEIISDIENTDGTVAKVSDLYDPEFVVALINITGITPKPNTWWTATETNGAWTFLAPSA